MIIEKKCGNNMRIFLTTITSTQMIMIYFNKLI